MSISEHPYDDVVVFNNGAFDETEFRKVTWLLSKTNNKSRMDDETTFRAAVLAAVEQLCDVLRGCSCCCSASSTDSVGRLLRVPGTQFVVHVVVFCCQRQHVNTVWD